MCDPQQNIQCKYESSSAPAQSQSPMQPALPYAQRILLPLEAEQVQPFIFGEPK